MKFTVNWLRQYVELPLSAEELAEKLTFAGLEVEQIQPWGRGIPAEVVVGEIVASEKHPNADKLSVCRVRDGAGERQIVCGAKNYRVGDKAPLALPGAKLPNGVTIGVAKLRGVESQGMLCSAEELGLGKGEEGLMILPADAPVGQRFVDYLGGPDVIIEIEVTPNRPDWLSVLGIARELSALTGAPLRWPTVPAGMCGDVPGLVTVEAPELCPRYTGRVITGVKVGPSPLWMRLLLEKVGVRSINNVVDVTNFVLLETGHPLHAFDRERLAGGRVIVRRARAGERFEAIDGSRHELNGEMLVIADETGPVALAGIMGGLNSEIRDQTSEVLLESAWFEPANVRRTSKRCTLTSESSYRFERGVDIGGVLWASDRATQLITELAGGQSGPVVDVVARPITRRRVACRHAQVERLLGIKVPAEEVRRIFVSLGMKPVREDADEIEVEVPTFRVDVEREADLIEEVCRVYGVEKIPAAMEPSVPATSEFDAVWDRLMELRRALTALGYHEALNYTMVARGEVAVQNPLQSHLTALRASLIPGLLQNVRTNVARQQNDVRLFEVGRVFRAGGTESWMLGIAATGRRHPGDWERTESLDYLDVKGVLEELGLEGEVRVVAGAELRQWDLRQPVVVTEVALDEWLQRERPQKQYRELPRFPAVVRDVAWVVDESVTHAVLLAAMQRHRTNLLERIELFDIFRGGTLPAGKKSVAYSLTYRAADRTLTDREVNEAHERLVRAVQRELGCEIRERQTAAGFSD